MKIYYLLLADRNQAPLEPNDVRRAINTFLGLDTTVVVRHDPLVRTGFRVSHDESGEEFGEVVFGPDIYPGRGIVNPNAVLSLDAAASHELAHYYRWRDKTELPGGTLTHLDEALTSLEAILRYEQHLKSHDVRMLVADAIQRISLYIADEVRQAERQPDL